MTPESNQNLQDLLLEHIGRYRISFLKVMEKIYGGVGDVAGAIRALKEANLIKSLGKAQGFGSALGNHTAYQLTRIGVPQAAVSKKRAKPLDAQTLEPSFRVLWLCCMGATRFARLDERHLKKLLGTPLSARCSAYCMEIEGDRRIYRIRLVSAESTDESALRETRKDLLRCAEDPILKARLKPGQYGNILAVSKPERRKRLQEMIEAKGLRHLGHVRVELVPDLNQIAEVMRDR